MSIFQNRAPTQPFAVPASLNRLLVLCRFDLRQKSWALPSPVIRRDRHFKFSISADAAALALAVSKTIIDFSDPSLGAINPSNPALAGLESGPRPHVARKTEHPKKEQ
jgi:hypothetical protein